MDEQENHVKDLQFGLVFPDGQSLKLLLHGLSKGIPANFSLHFGNFLVGDAGCRVLAKAMNRANCLVKLK